MVRHSSTGFRASAAACSAFILAAIAIAAPTHAQQISISGAWNGTGTVSTPSGNVEKVRCRATFNQSGKDATMSATCANASARVTQYAELTRISGNKFSGEFTNPEYGISGSIRVTVNGNTLSASLQGGGGSAFINLSR